MTLTHESLRPLVGKTVTVTRNDIPGSWTGVLLGREDDVLELRTSPLSFEVFPFARVEAIMLYVLHEDSGAMRGVTVYAASAKPSGTAKAEPTPSRYQWSYKGVSFDFYRLCEILGITHHAQAHALKKVIRAGRSVKSLEQDIEEAIACLERWKGMVLEDKSCQE